MYSSVCILILVSFQILQKLCMSSEANKAIREQYRNLLIEQQEKVNRAGDAGLPVKELENMIEHANNVIVRGILESLFLLFVNVAVVF